MRGLIGIEGSSYVGKTTVANKLSDMGYGVIPEYDTFGPFPESDESVAGLKRVVDELLEREKQRKGLILRGKVNFEDRTPISLITFEEMSAFDANASDKKRIHQEVRDYTILRIVALSEEQKITLPDSTAVLRITDKQKFEDRVKGRGVTEVGSLAIFTTQLYIAQKSLEYAELLFSRSKPLLIDVDAMTPQALATELIKFAEQIYN